MDNGRILLILAFVGVALAASASDGVAIREKRATIVCSAQNFMPLDICGSALVPLVSGTSALKCAGNLKRVDLFSMVKSYVINGAEVAGNKLDFSSTVNQIAYGDRICYVECIFKDQKFFKADGQTLDFAVITSSFLSGLTATMTPIVQAAITKCSAKTANVVPATITTVLGTKCQLKPAIFFQCMREQLLLKDPVLSKSATCIALRNILATCDPFL